MNETITLTLSPELQQWLIWAGASLASWLSGVAGAAYATRKGGISDDPARARWDRARIAAWPLTLAGVAAAWLLTRPAVWSGDLGGWLGRPKPDPWGVAVDGASPDDRFVPISDAPPRPIPAQAQAADEACKGK